MELTLRIPIEETKHVAMLFELARVGVIDERSIVCADDRQSYELNVDDKQAAYVLELLDDAIDSHTFESFAGWKRRHRDQLQLNLVPASNHFQLVDGKEA